MAKAREYYVVFAKSFWQSVRESLGFREFIFELFSLPVGAGYYLTTYGFDAMTKEVISFVAFSLALPGFLASAFILYHLIHTPVKIYGEQTRQLHELRSKYEVIPETVNLQIEGFNDILGNNVIGIRITNPTSQKITDLSVKLHSLVRIVEPDEREKIVISEANCQFCSGPGSRDKNVVLPANPVIIYLAKLEPQRNDRIPFLLEETYFYPVKGVVDADGFTVIKAAFEIALRITGMMNNIPIPIRTFKAPIHFEGEMRAQAVRKGSSEITMPAVPTSITIGPEIR